MKYPNFREEKKLWKKGFKRVVCLDEAGRGPLAGPVVATAVMIKSTPHQNLVGGKIQNLEIKDSKKLSWKKREKLYKLITKSPFIKWGIGRVSEKIIDKINILEATKLAMIRAVKNLEKKLSHLFHDRRKRSIIDFLILDGNFTLPEAALAKAKINLPIHQKSIVKADEKVFSCAVASILAKVRRDKIMLRYHQKYPRYGFKKHKGYPTKYHLKMLKKYGPCKIHRKSFRPVIKSQIAKRRVPA